MMLSKRQKSCLLQVRTFSLHEQTLIFTIATNRIAFGFSFFRLCLCYSTRQLIREPTVYAKVHGAFSQTSTIDLHALLC